MKKKALDLKIKNLTVSLPSVTIHPNLPTLCFSMIIVGKSGSGKSNVLCNLLLKYQRHFKDNLYIFQKTPCDTIKKNLIDNEKINGIRFKNLFDKKGNDILTGIVKSQEEYIRNDETPPYVCGI
jgi:ABC-type transporter Mla maintaining outer membrane lipid asymmetry ATPase subunit MlaF